ncbi:Phd finger domain-containing protein [Mycena sanguinolenta]|uniref:Phd finger domain-containing protein n=1 Tax=Mycena sanguinolenta TaxID=230812 RepID=A0A8H6ZD28_9AGAR|nr:Phd finger domain-containing protein [Mycena sanguinolenta]
MIVAFDHRNHGTRLRNNTANLSFAENANHVHDMWAIQSGTAQDVSFLIDLLEAYLFPMGNRVIAEWGVAGISLGGHSTWMAAAADPRIKLAIPIIGCPDYLKLMEPRAASHGIAMAPPHFPESLLKVIRAKALTALPYTSVGPENPFLGKKVLILCGGDDMLVPWTASQAFVEGLETGPAGSKEYIIYDGVGHAVPPPMVQATRSWCLLPLPNTTMPRRAAPKPAELQDLESRQPENTSSEEDPFAQKLFALRTNWKWAAFSQFFFTFSHLFQMEDVTLTDIEDDLARDTNLFLPRVMTRLLFILSYDRKVSLDNWQSALRKQHKRRDPTSNPIGPEPPTEGHGPRFRYESVSVDEPTPAPVDDATLEPGEGTTAEAEADDGLGAAASSDSRANTEEKATPAPDLNLQEEEEKQETKDWLELPMLAKLDSMHLLTEWQFQNPTRLRTLMKSDDDDATWRIEPIGYDAKSNAYWLIGASAAKSKRPAAKRARLANEDPKLTITVPAGGGRAAKAQAKAKLDQQAKELAELNRAAGIKTPAARETRRGRNPVAPVRPVGTRVSARLRGGDDDEWQAIPDDWLEEGTKKKASSKLKTGLESDDDSISDLTQLSEDLVEETEEQEQTSPTADPEPEEDQQNREEDQPADFVEWETICVTLFDWEHIAERFANGTHYTEKALYKVLTKDIVPVITEELREIERKRRLEEAVVHRKRSSRIANKEAEKEEARQLARQKAEVVEKKNRAQRLEARLAKEEAERDRREAAREQRRKAKEEQETQSATEDESVDVVADDPSPVHLSRMLEPSQRNGTAATSRTSTSGTRTPDWILNCEICHRSGINLDDGMPMVGCGLCSQWHHTTCHDIADQQAGRPRRNWDQVEFICRQCQARRMPKSSGQYPQQTAPSSYMAPASSSYATYEPPRAAHPPRDYPGLHPAAVNGSYTQSGARGFGPQHLPYPTPSSSVNYRAQVQAAPPPRISAGPSYNAPGPSQQQYQAAFDRSPAQFSHIAPNVNGHRAPMQYQVQSWNISSGVQHNTPYPPPKNGVLHDRHQYPDVAQWHAGGSHQAMGSQQATTYGYHNVQ